METWVSVAVCIILAAAGIFLIKVMMRTGHFFKSFLLSAVSGVLSLFAVSLLGLGHVVNTVGLGIAALAGIPGVILLIGFSLLK